jgi:DNA-binding transcriptional regulator YiaG
MSDEHAKKDKQIARGKRVKSLRKLTDLSRRTFAQKYGVTASTLQNWEEARVNGLSEKGAFKIVEALKSEGIHCTVDWLLNGTGQAPKLPEHLLLDALPTSSVENKNETELITKELEIFLGHYADSTYYTIKDDGMAPQFNQGDIVAGIRRYDPKDIHSLINQNCIVLTQSGEQLFRQVRSSDLPRHYTLACINPNTTVTKPFIYDIEIVSAAPVVWFRKKDS